MNDKELQIVFEALSIEYDNNYNNYLIDLRKYPYSKDSIVKLLKMFNFKYEIQNNNFFIYKKIFVYKKEKEINS